MSDLRNLLDEAIGTYSPSEDEASVRRRVRSREVARRVGAALVGLVVFAGAAWVAWEGLRPTTDTRTGGDGAEPIYWVDGARPTFDNSEPHSEEELDHLCVPYSADRPDVKICGDVPGGWTPAPLPYHDAAICDSALRWMAESHTYGSVEVDEASCKVIESTNGGAWHVVFVKSNATGNVHVPYDPTGEIPWAAHP
jgi:hypothetical protein